MIGNVTMPANENYKNYDHNKYLSSDLSTLNDVSTGLYLLHSQAVTTLYEYLNFTQLQVYCTKSWHSRIIHFITTTTQHGKQFLELVMGKRNSWKESQSTCADDAFQRLKKDNSVLMEPCNNKMHKGYGNNPNKLANHLLYRQDRLLHLQRFECDDRYSYSQYNSEGKWMYYVR